MNAKQRHQDNKVKTYKETAKDHDGRLQAVEDALHNERLNRFAWWAFIGLVMLLGGGFYDKIAAFLIKTKHFSCIYSEGVGLRQGLTMSVGAILLLVNARLFEKEMRK